MELPPPPVPIDWQKPILWHDGRPARLLGILDTVNPFKHAVAFDSPEAGVVLVDDFGYQGEGTRSKLVWQA